MSLGTDLRLRLPHPVPGESAIEAGKPSSAIELALIDWGEKRAELDAGEITQEEYEDWKDSYSPGKKVL